jgi:hypothetical protein
MKERMIDVQIGHCFGGRKEGWTSNRSLYGDELTIVHMEHGG